MFSGFQDRAEAGRILADRLAAYAGRADTIVLALPRGGVPVAYEVARRLKAPLDVFVVRKMGVPGHEEYAFGAIASGGSRVVNWQVADSLGIGDEAIERVTRTETEELHRRERLYRGSRPEPDIKGKTVIVVDDGLATGATMQAAVEALKQQKPAQIVIAVPVGSRDTCEFLGKKADVMCVCAVTPEPFHAVGLWYRDFSQTTDNEVRELLDRADARSEASAA
jgi:predicted phosphoribosyltransferase